MVLDRAIARCEDGSKNRAELLRRRATLVKVGRSYPSSQTCSGCGARTKLALWQRVYHCTDCGLTLDRDVNAARTIAAAGLRLQRMQHQQHVASIRGETVDGEPRPGETEPAADGAGGRGSFEAATGPAAVPVAAA